ncbi:MAG: GIY-YIG nuclease family protein [Ignavibacteriae bacterium]|nr:GIY-YIG nuclease family protein [Ignavibacteriota bacterium]
MYFVYVLWSDKLKKRYVGYTDDRQKRLEQHNAGKTLFTSQGNPWIVIHSEAYQSLMETRERERFLKSGVGRKWLDEKFPG